LARATDHKVQSASLGVLVPGTEVTFKGDKITVPIFGTVNTSGDAGWYEACPTIPESAEIDQVPSMKDRGHARRLPGRPHGRGAVVGIRHGVDLSLDGLEVVNVVVGDERDLRPDGGDHRDHMHAVGHKANARLPSGRQQLPGKLACSGMGCWRTRCSWQPP
jgi:hypothetical protein